MAKRDLYRILAKKLLREKKAAGSWRALQADKYPEIPARTLWRIASSHGEYLPQKIKYREILGIRNLPCSKCHRNITIPKPVRTYKHIIDLSPQDLLYVFEHREEM